MINLNFQLSTIFGTKIKPLLITNSVDFIVSKCVLVSFFGFGNLFLHPLIFLMVESEIFYLCLKKGNHGVFLIETGCKVFWCNWELFSTWISYKAHFLYFEIGIIIKLNIWYFSLYSNQIPLFFSNNLNRKKTILIKLVN